jgi:hypothetical protein
VAATPGRVSPVSVSRAAARSIADTRSMSAPHSEQNACGTG